MHSFIRGKGGDPHKDFSSFSLDLDDGKDGTKGQPTLPPIPPQWGGMPPNSNPYFPWYPTMLPMMVVVVNFDGGKKLLNYLEYIKNSDLDTHVRVFKQVIKVNGVTQEGTKIAHFQWML
jgi:hypothetical protein